MKKLLLAALIGIVGWQINATESTWLTDLPAAKAQAKTDHKIVLMDFTGSDWCPWCKKFKKDVLDTPEFEAYAAKNVVEVEVDFPDKKKQSKELKEANNALKKTYKVQGFPTLVILDQHGKEIGRQEGYADGGPKAFIAMLEKFKSAP